jgi:hypothetical protein
MMRRGSIFSEDKTVLGWKSGKSQTPAQKLPPGGRHRILFARSPWPVAGQPVNLFELPHEGKVQINGTTDEVFLLKPTIR